MTDALNLAALVLEMRQAVDALTLGPKINQWMFVYMGAETENSCWYHRPAAQEVVNVPCPFDALVGYIEMLDFEERIYKGQSNLKMKLLVVGDRPYHLQCGAETMFAKTMYSAIAAATIEELQRPIEIAPYQGNEGTIFASITTLNGKLLRTQDVPDWKTGDWQDFINIAQKKVEQAMAARNKPSRMKKGDSEPAAQPTSRPQTSSAKPQKKSQPQTQSSSASAPDMPDVIPDELPSSLQRIKFVKDLVRSPYEQVRQAMEQADPDKAAIPDIKEAVRSLTRPEASTVITNLLWWYGLQHLAEQDLKPHYNTMFMTLETDDEQTGIRGYFNKVRKPVAAVPADIDF